MKKDGTITASEFRAVASAGGYTSSSPAVTGVCGEGLINAYETANYHFTGYSVFTNSPTGGEMRGFGGPQATFCHELHIDKVAEAIGMNPLCFARRIRRSRVKA